MTSFTVNATISFAGWLTVEADTADEAFEEACQRSASEWEYDSSTAELEFNVTPEVEAA